MQTTVITSSKTGLKAEIPAKFAKGKSQTALDTLVFDAHNDHPVSKAVCRTLGIKAA